ncbi:MAG: DNA repair protein RecO [Lachnospiraceae bacterium]|nr:DNA repair protein RecO [Lachnospiraceae bacterium]
MALAEVNGIILKSFDYSEYDRRLILLTAERGKITVFARGVKRPGNRWMAATQPFAFGRFRLSEGRSAYSLREVDIQNYFDGLRMDLDAYYPACFFLEIADYYARENNDDKELLKLLYAALLALLSPSLDNNLVKNAFIIKAIAVNGEFPGFPSGRKLLPGTIHSINFILETPPEKVFNFAVKEDVLEELTDLARLYGDRCMNTEFKSLEIMKKLSLA